MLKEFTAEKNRYIQAYLFGLMLLVSGLVLSKPILSVGEFVLGAVWFIEGNYRNKIRNWLNNKALLLFLGIFFLHIIGLIYTSDFQYAFKDIRIKLPLLVIPLLLSSIPALTKDQLQLICKVFILSLVASSFVSLYVYITENPNDPRELSPLISHIRLSLMICFAIFISSYWAYKSLSKSKLLALLYTAITIWLTLYLFMIEALSGVILFFGIGFSSLFYLFFHTKRVILKAMSVVIVISVLGVLISSFFLLKGEFSPNMKELTANLEEKTIEGNPYFHDTIAVLNENGNLIWTYVCENELRREWTNKSVIAFDSTGYNGQVIKDVLYRYMSSKDLKKDAESFAKLSDEDISHIEHGMTNHLYAGWWGFKKKIDQLKWEYWNLKYQKNPSGHSIMQRFELWENAIRLISKHPLIGVGTGDLKKEFAAELELRNSSLAGTNLRSHNQFLSITIQFGLIGLVLFLIFIILPIKGSVKKPGFLFLVFITISILSMFVEDTLETQIGASFFAIFYSIFILLKDKDTEEEQDI